MKLTALLLAVTSALTIQTASAEDLYPQKPVTIVAPYGAGGASDLAARSLAEAARKYIGDQPVLVVNKTGNGGMNGARFVSKAKADGYTLLLARAGMALYPAVNKDSKLNWNSYSFLGSLEATPMILAVNASSTIKTVEALLTAIKQDEGAMTFAASGPTAIDGFTVQAMLVDAGLNPQTATTLIPYRGGSALSTALLGGHVDFLAISAGSLMPHIKAGKLRPLAVFAPKRMKALPDVPTMSEMGYKKSGEITGWSALYGPKDLPKDVATKWKQTLVSVAKDEGWLSLADKRGSISTVGELDQEAYSKSQYELFRNLAVKFGYVK